jgi:SPP1 family predicted phage head-tail adaptor
MQAGELRERVTIQSPTASADEYGQAPPTWADVATVYAGVRPLRAGEILRAEQPGMETTHVVRLRYRADVAPECRLKWGTRYLYPSSIVNVGARNRELELLCTERRDHLAA